MTTNQTPPQRGTVSELITKLLDRGYESAARPTLNAVAKSVNSGLIQQRLTELETEAQRLADLGEPLTPDNAILRALLADLDDTLQRDSSLIDGASNEVQQSGIDAAGNIQRQLALPGMTNAQLRALNIRWNVPDPEAVARLVNYSQSPAWSTLMNTYGPDVLAVVNNQAIKGIALGWSPLHISREIRRITEGLPAHVANNQLRTLQLTSYRDGTSVHQTANRDICQQVIRIATRDERTCLSCIAQHGDVIWDAETDADSPVPRVNDHHQGRCLLPGQMVKTAGGLKPVEEIQIGDYVLTHMGRYKRVTATFSRDYAGQIIQIGDLMVTPEHPILTQRGWVEARNLSASDTFLTLNLWLARDSIRKISQPSDLRIASRFSSLGRFMDVVCHRGSYSTASIWSEKAKSILYVPTASSGVGNNPAAFRASRNANSKGLKRVFQFSCRLIARFAAASFVDPARIMRVTNSGSFSSCRRNASLPLIGSILQLFISFISVLVLIPASFVSSLYEAFSSTYLRFSHESAGSPSLASNSRNHSELFSVPGSLPIRGANPIFRRLKRIAVRVLPITTAISSAVNPSESSFDNSASSSAVHLAPVTAASYSSMTTIIHQPEYIGKVYDLTVETDHSFFANGIAVHNCTSVIRVKGRPPLNIQSGEDWFNSLPPERQAQQRSFADSPGKFAAYSTGKVTLRDFVHPYSDPVFNEMIREASLTDALKPK